MGFQAPLRPVHDPDLDVRSNDGAGPNPNDGNVPERITHVLPGTDIQTTVLPLPFLPSTLPSAATTVPPTALGGVFGITGEPFPTSPSRPSLSHIHQKHGNISQTLHKDGYIHSLFSSWETARRTCAEMHVWIEAHAFQHRVMRRNLIAVCCGDPLVRKTLKTESPKGVKTKGKDSLKEGDSDCGDSDTDWSDVIAPRSHYLQEYENQKALVEECVDYLAVRTTEWLLGVAPESSGQEMEKPRLTGGEVKRQSDGEEEPLSLTAEAVPKRRFSPRREVSKEMIGKGHAREATVATIEHSETATDENVDALSSAAPRPESALSPDAAEDASPKDEDEAKDAPLVSENDRTKNTIFRRDDGNEAEEGLKEEAKNLRPIPKPRLSAPLPQIPVTLSNRSSSDSPHQQTTGRSPKAYTEISDNHTEGQNDETPILRPKSRSQSPKKGRRQNSQNHDGLQSQHPGAGLSYTAADDRLNKPLPQLKAAEKLRYKLSTIPSWFRCRKKKLAGWDDRNDSQAGVDPSQRTVPFISSEYQQRDSFQRPSTSPGKPIYQLGRHPNPSSQRLSALPPRPSSSAPNQSRRSQATPFNIADRAGNFKIHANPLFSNPPFAAPSLPQRPSLDFDTPASTQDQLLALIHVVLYHLPRLIVTKHAGSSHFGSGGYSSDISDVSRFYTCVRRRLIVKLLRYKGVQLADTVQKAIVAELNRLDEQEEAIQANAKETMLKGFGLKYISFPMEIAPEWRATKANVPSFDILTITERDGGGVGGISYQYGVGYRNHQADSGSVCEQNMSCARDKGGRQTLIEEARQKVEEISHFRLVDQLGTEGGGIETRYLALVLWAVAAQKRIQQMESEMADMVAAWRKVERMKSRMDTDGRSGSSIDGADVDIGWRDFQTRGNAQANIE